ncbi:GGDEF domain-containing protein [Halarsenatibacter silvermanii]|uniref:ECF transporter S component, folate family n=1 Tax=Halarsenatibacter silvermanii TaxID=321763 RepID=A0A1G9QCG1_9FIRM|nr:folate family ECF transporter S component [Halarsenatibacter silvermanii]SDM08706.1 ECF transporter S component, folate family [Halarsenatibacter silvermanii]
MNFLSTCRGWGSKKLGQILRAAEMVSPILFLIFLGVFLANPGNVVSFMLPGGEESLRLGLTPLVTMMAGMIMGPLPGVLIAFFIDFTSVAIWYGLEQFLFFFAFAVVLRGLLAGYLYNRVFKRFTFKSVFLTIALTYVITSGLLTPLALNYHYGQPLMANIGHRLSIQALAVPIYAIIAFFILKFREENQKLKKMYIKMEKLAQTDELTGLANRRAFIDTLNKYISAARRHEQELHLIYLDLDDFKQINDSCGHQVGVILLRQVGRVLREVVRAEDASARLGGDEFALALFNADADQSRQVAKRIRTGVENIKIKEVEGCCLSVSLGLAGLQQEDTYEDLLMRADKAMYRSKKKYKKQMVRETKRAKPLQELEAGISNEPPLAEKDRV